MLLSLESMYSLFAFIRRLRVHGFLQANIKMIFMLTGIIVGFLILEASLRIFEKKTYDLSVCVSLDKNFHHVMIPNKTCRFKTDEWDVIYKINSLGLRDNEILPKKEDEFRILLLGDSFVQGHGVEAEKTFGKVLEQKLNKKQDGKYQVINAGVFGYSPLLEYLYLKERGLDLKPDLIILGFDLTDFWEDRQRFNELQISSPDILEAELQGKIINGEAEFSFEKINTNSSSSKEVRVVLPRITYKLKSFLRKNFKVYSALADFVKKRDPVIQQDALNQGNVDKDIVALIRADKISDDDWEKLWGLPIFNLQEIKKLTDNKKIPLIIVLIPEAVQVSDREWPGRAALGLPANFYDPRGPFQDELVKRLSPFGIDFVDLLDGFKKSNIFPLYFTNDGHWRESGHELAADIIYNTLNTSGFYFLLNR